MIALFVMISLSAQEEKRCAVDIGSGWMKMQTALVDTENNKIIRLLDEPFFSYVPLANYYAQDGELNATIQQQAIEAFNTILLICAQKKIHKICGVATEIFRKAGTSGALLFTTLQTMAQQQFGEQNVHMQLISQELEGKLGFLTAVALCPEIEKSTMLSWDSGNASFQFVMQNKKDEQEKYCVFEGKMGSALAAKLFVEQVRKQSYQRGAPINPIDPKEIDEFIKIVSESFSFSDEFIRDISNMRVIGIGGPTAMFCIASKALGNNSVARQELYDIIGVYAQLEQMSPAILSLDATEPETVLTRLMLLYAVMQKLSIDKVTYKASTGNTLGILLSESFWH